MTDIRKRLANVEEKVSAPDAARDKIRTALLSADLIRKLNIALRASLDDRENR